MIKTILFDMDGVLIDAREWHYESLNRALDLFGMAIDYDTHLAAYDGLPTRKKLQMLTKSRGLPVGLHDFLNARKQRFTSALVHARCRPVYQHRRALSRLKQEGYRLAVCSNSIRSTVELMMDMAQLRPYLDLLLSNEDVAVGKPDPAIYSKAIAHFGVAPEEALILEDNDHGIQAARASGAHVLVVGSPDDVSYSRIRNALDTIA